jgi:hypothetical protein
MLVAVAVKVEDCADPAPKPLMLMLMVAMLVAVMIVAVMIVIVSIAMIVIMVGVTMIMGRMIGPVWVRVGMFMIVAVIMFLGVIF